MLAVLPLYHINAFAVTMLAPLAHGGSLAMPPKFSAARFWQQTLDAQCTWINVVPTMISYLLEGAVPERGTFEFYVLPGDYLVTASNEKGCSVERAVQIAKKDVLVELELREKKR